MKKKKNILDSHAENIAAFSVLANQIKGFHKNQLCSTNPKRPRAASFQAVEVENGNESNECDQKLAIANNIEKHLWKKHKKVTFSRCIDI